MPQAKLLLWDIDGTLLSAGPSPREAIESAIQSVLARPFVDGGMRLDGRTDPAIFRQLLLSNGVSESEVETLMQRALRELGPELAKRRSDIKSQGRVHPGVVALLSTLAEREVLNTVLTGNLAVGAVLKLSTFNLDEVIDVEVGAFGSDKENRNELVDVALKRVARKHHAHFDSDEVWVIGDTPHDFEAARSNGTRCLLVATGRYGFEELSQLGADAVFADLGNAQNVMRALELR